MKTLKITVEVPIPEGATHYAGEHPDHIRFYKLWIHDPELDLWASAGHVSPPVKEIPT